MTKHKHRWNLEAVEVIYDDRDGDEPILPTFLKSLLRLSDFAGDRIVVRCLAGKHVGVWMDSLDGSWKPTIPPRWIVPLATYESATTQPVAGTRSRQSNALAAAPIPSEPPTLYRQIQIGTTKAGEVRFQGRVERHPGAE